MNLLRIWRIVARHKLLTLPVIVLTVAGLAYTFRTVRPLYQATDDYLLLRPPSPPTEADIARDPSLAGVNANNIYVRVDDQSVIGQILASQASEDTTVQHLVAAGADRRFTVAPVAKYGVPTPLVEVTGVGTTPEQAVRTKTIVGQEVVHLLHDMQALQGTDPRFMITALPVSSSSPRERVSSQLRALLGVLGAGTILLFLAVSLGDALDQRCLENLLAAADHPPAADERGAMRTDILPARPERHTEASDHNRRRRATSPGEPLVGQAPAPGMSA